MNTPRNGWRLLPRCVVATAVLNTVIGCHSLPGGDAPPNPTPAPPHLAATGSHTQDCFHVFLIHGLDPFDSANMKGLVEHIKGLGFAHTSLSQFYQAGQVEDDIRALHRDDPGARFVVIGFSLGVGMASSVVESLQPDGVTVDLLVYLDGKAIVVPVTDAPTNARRVINVTCPGYLWTAPTRYGTENLLVTDTWHFGVPQHPLSVEAITRELNALAAPKTVTAKSPPPAPSPAPEPVVDADSTWPSAASIALRSAPEMRKEAAEIKQRKKDEAAAKLPSATGQPLRIVTPAALVVP